MIYKFKEIIKKNFILLWRSRNVILTVFFGPLILISLLGLAFNNNALSNISVASYSEEYNDLGNSLLSGLQNKGFDVVKLESESECINSVKLGKNHLCIIMPVDFGIIRNNELVVYVDQSKVNLVENIMNLLSENIQQKTSKISLDLTSILLDKLREAGELSLNSNELVSEIRGINQDLEKIIKKITDDLDKLGLEINQAITKINELKSDVQKGADSKETVDEILGLVDDSRDLIDDIEKDVNSSDLKRLDKKLRNIENKFKDSDVFDQDYWNEMDLLVNDLENNAIFIKNLKNGLSGDLTLIKKDLAKEINTLDDLQANLHDINLSVTSIKVKNVSKIVNPIITDIRPIVPEGLYLNYIFPTLLVLIIMFGSVLLSSTAYVVEKKDRAYFRNFISPTNNLIFLMTRYITDFMIVVLQIIIFLGISLIFLSIGIFSSFSISLIFFIVISFFVLLGIFIGCISNSEESSVLFSIVITSIMLFFSSTILPIEGMAGIVYKISKFNPFVLSETALRKSIVYGLSINLIFNEILLLLIWILVIIGLILIATKINKKQIGEGIKNIIFVEE